MGVGPLTVEVIAVCCLAAYLLHHYGNFRKQHIIVTCATFIAWYFSLMIIFILPLDVSNTCYRQCVEDHQEVTTTRPTPILPSNDTALNTTVAALPPVTTHVSITPTTLRSTPSVENISAYQPIHADYCQKPWSYVEPVVLRTLWRIVYWTSQALTWLVLPLMQSYSTAGDFTVPGKMKSALIENAIYYGTYLLIFGVCLVYVAVKPELHLDGPQLKVLAITASNTWGLFLLVLLLGYGLVEVPRTCWNNSKKGYMLAYTYFRIAKLSTEKTEAEEVSEDVLEDVKKAADTIRQDHPLRKHVNTILEKCPESLRSTVRRNRNEFDERNPTETPTEKSLVRLHKKVITASQSYRRTQCQWDTLINKAFELEDISANEGKSVHTFIRSNDKYQGFFKSCYSPALEWYWKCWLRPWGLQVLTVFLVIFAAMIVWSECLFFITSPVLSLFAIFLQLAKDNYNYLTIEFVSCLTIAFLCVCAYYTIFKIRVFNYYYLASHHQTDENSLLFCGILLCRLTPPLCLNFLGLIHMDTHVTKKNGLLETYYTEIMGHMDVISFISNGFNIYFPIAIVLLCIATYFNLGSRFLHFLGFQQFVGEDDLTQELVDEGKELVRREKRRRQRIEDGEERRRNWQERFESNRGSRFDSDSDSGRKRSGKMTAARSPDENDRSELLREIEPVDYTGESGFDYIHDMSINDSDHVGRYQSQPTRLTSLPRSGSATRSSRTPPKGIFDDV